MTRYVAAVVALTIVYALALASFHPWDLLIGAVLAAALLFAARRAARRLGGDPGGDLVAPPGERPPALGRVVAVVPLAGAVARDVLVGAWKVVLVTLHLRAANRSFVTVPLAERTRMGVAVSALLTALVPGTLLVEVDEEEGVMLIHAIDAPDPDAAREEQQEFYRRYQRKVFP